MKKYSMILAVFALLLAAVAMTGCSQEGPVAPNSTDVAEKFAREDPRDDFTVYGLIKGPNQMPVPEGTVVRIWINYAVDESGNLPTPTATDNTFVAAKDHDGLYYNYEWVIDRDQLEYGDRVLVTAPGGSAEIVWNGQENWRVDFMTQPGDHGIYPDL